MRNMFDFSSWQGVLSTLLGLVLMSLLVVGADEMVAGRSIEIAELVVSLRTFIRYVLGLDPVPPGLTIPRQGPLRTAGASSARGGGAGGGKRGERAGGAGGRGGAGGVGMGGTAAQRSSAGYPAGAVDPAAS